MLDPPCSIGLADLEQFSDVDTGGGIRGQKRLDRISYSDCTLSIDGHAQQIAVAVQSKETGSPISLDVEVHVLFPSTGVIQRGVLGSRDGLEHHILTTVNTIRHHEALLQADPNQVINRGFAILFQQQVGLSSNSAFELSCCHLRLRLVGVVPLFLHWHDRAKTDE